MKKIGLNTKSNNKCDVFFLLLALIFNSSACKKMNWYDKKPEVSLSTPSTIEDLQALMNNVDLMNRFSPGLGEIASDGHYVNPTRVNNLDKLSLNAYTWSKLQPYTNVPDWNASSLTSGPYPRIFTCNIVLELVKKITPNGNKEKTDVSSIRGQALFHRAKTFYELAQIFAPPYSSTSADTDLGIPLRLESDYNVPSVRSSVKENYDQIINDLLEAKELLPDNPILKTYPSRPAALAMLARVYLVLGDYTKALAYSSQCLEKRSELIDFNVLNPAEETPFAMFNEEVILHTEIGVYRAINPVSYMLIDTALYNLYDANDLRKQVFFANIPGSDIISYKGSYAGSSMMFSGLSTNELYLIRAESNARLGNISESLADLNTLVVTRYKAGSFAPIVSKSAGETLLFVLSERRKELLLRGLRWTDLRRLNIDDKYKTSLSRTVNGMVYTLEPNSYKYTFPIPDDVLQMTTMIQNTGW